MKIKNLIILILPLFLWSVNSIAQNKKELYSRTITGILSPYQTYKRALPISSKNAKKVNHYKFEYDEQNRLVQISFYKNNLPNNGAYFFAAFVKYQYLPNKIIRTYFDHNKRPSTMWRHYYGEAPIHKEVFELDEVGNKKSLTLFDKEGNQIETGYGTYRFEWDLVKNGEEVIQRMYKKSGELNILIPFFDFYVTHLTFDHNGNLDLVKNYGKERGKLTVSEKKRAALVDFYFDDDGIETSYSFYDDKGNLVKRQDSNAGHYGYATIQYTNLKNGKNKFFDGYEISYLDERSKPINNTHGFAIEVMSFDKFGNFSGIEYLDKDRKKVVPDIAGIGYHKVEVLYNEQGNRSELRYYDSNRKLMNNKAGIALIKLEYDKDRNQIKKISYNKDLKVVKEEI